MTFFRDNNGKVVIGQRPNLWIIGWFTCLLLSLFVPHTAQNYLKLLADAFLILWAVLEIASGVNYFRRYLGAVVLVALLINHFWR